MTGSGWDVIWRAGGGGGTDSASSTGGAGTTRSPRRPLIHSATVRLARRVDFEGATPSAVRELRYALLALGVTDLEPFVLLMAAWDGYRVPAGFRLILPKCHTAYRSENALFREMVGEFVPPRWATLVIVGGDAA